ncbi:transposable element Tcb1 transposase [Trichonephila clavipes]|nr:transposable element Tcb1 transposase [Trichonephila clavipes]
MVVNTRTASSRQLAARWSIATGVLMSASSIRRCLLHRGLCARLPLYKIPLMANLRWLCLQWAHEHRAWKADWYPVVFSDESRFNLRYHDGHIRVRRYAGERCLPECVALSNDIVAKHLELRLGGRFRIMGDPICYELRVISIATGTSMKFYCPKSFPSFKELSFSRIMHAHMLQRLFETSVQPNACNFFLDLLIRRICRLLSTCGICLVGVSLVIHVLQLQKTNIC